MELLRQFRSASTNLKLLVILVVIALPVVGFVLGRDVDKYSSVDQEAESQAERLSEKGINPEKVAIKILPTNISWQADSVAYQVQNVYLTPDIADLGSARFNVSLREKDYFVVEVSVRDRRTSGERRLIPAESHFRVREGKIDSEPSAGNYLYLSPQENGTVFVMFPVEEGKEEITLLAGNLSRPRVITFDFAGEDITVKEGVFILKRGYFPEYSEELHP